MAKGCTLVHDCGIGAAFGEKDLALIDAVMKTNPPLRYAGISCPRITTPGKSLAFAWRAYARFTLNGIKAWADGSNQAQTGYQREPYLGSTGRGALNYQPSEIEAVVRKAHMAGWQVGIHANGDAAIDVAIDAFAQGTSGEGGHQLRHRIEHSSILHDEQIVRMKELGPLALVPDWTLSTSGAARFRIGFGPETGKARRSLPLRPRQGLANFAPLGFQRHSPSIRCVASRMRCARMKEGGGVLAPEQCITPMEALRAVTIDAAWQCNMTRLRLSRSWQGCGYGCA